MNEPSHLPESLTNKLYEFRRDVRRIKFIEGILSAFIGLAASYLLVLVLDRLIETPAVVRVLVLVGGAAVGGFGLPLVWHRWVWRQRRLDDVARLLRRKYPRLGDQVLGIVELARRAEGADGRSERLVRASIEQAVDAVKDRDLSGALPASKHRRWAWVAAGAAALAVLALVLVPEAAGNAMLRWLAPWKATERYTFAQVEELSRELVVPYAESYELSPALKEGSPWTPGAAVAAISGQPRLRAEVEDSSYPFELPPQQSDTDLRLRVGDDRERLRVMPRSRPELVSLVARVRLPEYLQYGRELEQEVRGGAARILGGAEVSWAARASRELAGGEVDGVAGEVIDGELVTAYNRLEEDVELEFQWRDVLGLAPRESLVLRVQSADDEAPLIHARRDSVEPVVLVSELLTFDLSAQDDYGLRQLGIEWSSGRGSAGSEKGKLGEKIVAAGSPEQRDLQAVATFSAEREGVAPGVIEVRAWAEDYLPGRERSYSPTFVLQVLDPTDHALWLTEQFGRWLGAARESYEREQQLHATNRELRALDPSELDRPENRRRVAQQAAEEQANAARLDALTDNGKRLAEQATKNPEFDPDALDDWAKMLEALEDIAEERMPSVADLLTESAGASGVAGEEGEGSEGTGEPSGGANPEGSEGSEGSGSEGQPGEPSGGEGSEGQAGEPSEGEGSEGQPGEPSGGEGQASEGEPSEGSGGGEPSEGQPSEGQPGGEGSPSETAPSVREGEQPPSSPSGGGESPPTPPVPSISDTEGGFLDPPKPSEGESGGGGAGSLGLPGTTLGALPEEEEEEGGEEGGSPASERLDEAVEEQRDLLDEFARVADELAEILGDLEASTFVKRLKAASRAQLEISSSINVGALDAFGLVESVTSEEVKEVAEGQAARALEESEAVYVIQSDLLAYLTRKPDQRFAGLLNDMKDSRVVSEIESLAAIVEENLSGQSIAAAEFWADTLDRWAEELVDASKSPPPPGDGPSQQKPSLPPEVILRVMQALRDEMALRDETRELDTARPALGAEVYRRQAELLAGRQEETAELLRSAMDEIAALPFGAQNFGKELQLLTEVVAVMDEAQRILERPNTGPEAVGAETEAIELLLQASRSNPDGGGGGGGGGEPGGGGSAESALRTPMSMLGSASEVGPDAEERSVGQATGRAGKEFPEEFRSGLDAYFHSLEQSSKP